MRIPLQALAAVFALTPMSAATEQLVSQPQSKLWVEGTSTLKSFKCSVPDFTLKVSAEGSGAVAAVLAGQKAVRTVVLTVPAEKIECGNATMNEHMRKALKVTESPTIRFTLDGYNVASADSGVAGTLRGALALGGSEKPIDVAATGRNAGDDALRVTGSADVALSAFDLKAPKLMFGRIKVGDKVRVKFDLTLKK
jgi:polyisoprenoid-binding protein YceI